MPIDYLRLSVTDRCNLRCQYCMPAEGVCLYPKNEILSYDEILRIIKVGAVMAGITKIRVTGGEPLVRKDINRLVEYLNNIPQITDLSMTTNGILLENCAQDLFNKGLKRINISLDTLDSQKFHKLTNGGELSKVSASINKVIEIGYSPVKINVVIIPGINDDEITEFARLTIEKSLHVRFIEFMPVGNINLFQSQGFLKVERMKEILRQHFSLNPPSIEIKGNGPAEYFQIPNALGTIGFISSLSNKFCNSCNRIRLTADGKIKTCLMNGIEIDIKTPLRKGCTDEDLYEIFMQAVDSKNYKDSKFNINQERTISQIGG